MKTYLSCGMIKEIPYILAEDGAFGIQEMEGKILTDRYIYPGDSIKYELDNALVGLYDIFRDCGRGYGETKSPSSCKEEKISEGFLSDIAKLAL